MKGDPLDPKGLIYEAYRIDGITSAECRSVFLDWALSMPADVDTNKAITALVAQYGATSERDHPMTIVLNDGLKAVETPRRRGGWRSRSRP
ncbi:MAG: hypothetical protein ABJI96_03885 [Paracoccaceae bacterium]